MHNTCKGCLKQRMQLSFLMDAKLSATTSWRNQKHFHLHQVQSYLLLLLTQRKEGIQAQIIMGINSAQKTKKKPVTTFWADLDSFKPKCLSHESK